MMGIDYEHILSQKKYRLSKVLYKELLGQRDGAMVGNLICTLLTWVQFSSPYMMLSPIKRDPWVQIQEEALNTAGVAQLISKCSLYLTDKEMKIKIIIYYHFENGL